MSVGAEVKSLGKSKWFFLLVGVVLGAVVLYAPVNAVVTYIKGKLPASLGGTAAATTTASASGQ